MPGQGNGCLSAIFQKIR